MTQLEMLLGLLRGEEAQADIPASLSPMPVSDQTRPLNKVMEPILMGIAGKNLQTPQAPSPLRQAPQGIIKPSLASEYKDAPKPVKPDAKALEKKNAELARPIVEPIMQSIAGNELITPKIPAPSNLNLVPPGIARPDIAPSYMKKGTPTPVVDMSAKPAPKKAAPVVTQAPKQEIQKKVVQKSPEVVQPDLPLTNLMIAKTAEEPDRPEVVRGDTEPITDLKGALTAPLADFVVENANPPLTELGFDAREAEVGKDIANVDKKLAETAVQDEMDRLSDIDLSRRKSPYSDKIEAILNEMRTNKADQIKAPMPERGKPDRIAELINAFGGAGLAMLTGNTTASLRAGSAAGQAGLKANQDMYKTLDDAYQMALKQKYTLDAQVIKNMDKGLTEALKAYLQLDNMDSREFKDTLAFQIEIQKERLKATEDIHGINSTEANNARNYYLNTIKAFQDFTAKMIEESIGRQEKVDDRNFLREENQKNRESFERRAQLGADARIREAQIRGASQGKGKGGGAPTAAVSKEIGFYSDFKPAYDEYSKVLEQTKFRPSAVRKPIVSEIATILSSKGKDGLNLPQILRSLGSKMTLTPQDSKEITLMYNMLIPVMRKQSGAAINADEWSTGALTYFPTYKDTPEIVKMKQNALSNKLQAMLVTIGNAELLPTLTPLSEGTSQLMPKGGKRVVRKLFNSKLNKTKFIYSDGSEDIVDGKK